MVRIWYTKGLSVTGDAIAMVRRDAPVWCMASHTDPASPLRAIADDFVVEPPTPHGAAYVDWVFETAIAARIDLVVVQRRVAHMSQARARFAQSGIALLLAATPERLDRIDDKRAFQEDLRDPTLVARGVSGHDIWPFATLIEFDAAWNVATAAASGPLCVKPVRGIFGAGFRRIEDGGDEMARIVSTDPGANFRLSRSAYRAALAGAATPVPQLLMPFLPGVERSVDFVAHDGAVLCAVSRAKIGHAQRLEVAGPSIDMARVLAARYRLNGVCNLQTREDDRGVPRVLEINPRMSGGLPLACLAGVNLPLMAVRAALGQDTGTQATPRGGALVRFEQVARIVGSP